MFGFEVGEERRYVLGPPDRLMEGEAAQWSIKLAGVNEEQGRLYGAFDLSMESRYLGGPSRQTRFGRSLRARVMVNDAGFPEVVTIYETMNNFTLEYSYSLQADNTYRLDIRWPDNESSFNVPVMNHSNLDLEGRTGLYLFANGRGDNNQQSFESNLFSNPGLLTLAMPSPVTEEWETELLVFSPSEGMPPYRDAAWLEFLNRPVEVRARFFVRGRIQARSAQQIEVGDRTVEGIELEVRGPFRRGFVDRDGRMLLLEHQPIMNRRPKHIRLLWPSEYQ
jgi:hypothetical protein